MALLVLALGCSRSGDTERASSRHVRGEVRLLSLAAIRHDLTHDLTMNEARRRFGPPHGPVAISGYLYPRWLLDDSNVLDTAFSLDGKQLHRAAIKNTTGKIIEVVLNDPER